MANPIFHGNEAHLTETNKTAKIEYILRKRGLKKAGNGDGRRLSVLYQSQLSTLHPQL